MVAEGPKVAQLATDSKRTAWWLLVGMVVWGSVVWAVPSGCSGLALPAVLWLVLCGAASSICCSGLVVVCLRRRPSIGARFPDESHAQLRFGLMANDAFGCDFPC